MRVHLSDRGIVIGATTDSEQLIWPYGALEATPLIGPADQTATLTYKYMPGVRLEVVSAEFGLKLARHAPQVAASHRNWGRLKLAMWAAAGLAVVWMVVAVFNSQPARLVAGFIPKEARQSLGRTVIGSMAERYRVCSAPAGQKALRGLRTRLLGGNEATAHYSITVVKWSLVNAFAAPGGQILLTNGLLQAASSAAEVAGVMAHEIGHSIELHPEAGIVRAVGLSAAIDMITGGGTLTGVGNLLLRNSYARQDERSADLQALRLLQQAGISQSGLMDFFYRIGRGPTDRGDTQNGGTIGGLFRTHPYPQERAARVRRSATYPTTPAMSRTEWRSLKHICDQTKTLEESLKSKSP